MKKAKFKKGLLMLVGLGLILPTMNTWAKGPEVELIYSQLSGNIQVEVVINNLPKDVVGLEIKLPFQTEVEVGSNNKWSSEIKSDYSHVIKEIGTTNEVGLYVVANEVITEASKLSVATINLKTEGSIETIKNQQSSIKLLDSKLLDTTSKTAIKLTPENETGGTSGSGETNETTTTTKPQEVKFADTSGHWAEKSIIKMATQGIIKGYENGTFKPANNITRGEFAAVITRAFNLESKGKVSPFKDVEEGKWYTQYIIALHEKGITTGRADGTFGVNDPITNEEIAVMIDRALDTKGIKIKPVTTGSMPFKDKAQISSYAKEAVQDLYQAGILNGRADGNYAPKDLTTRAQVAVMMDRVLEIK